MFQRAKVHKFNYGYYRHDPFTQCMCGPVQKKIYMFFWNLKPCNRWKRQKAKEMQEVSESTAGEFIYSYSWILIIVAFPSPCFVLALICSAKLTFKSPFPWVIVWHYVLPTLLSHFFYILFVWLWEMASTLTFYTSQNSLCTSKFMKNPQMISAQSGYLRIAFLQPFPSFHLSVKWWSPLWPSRIFGSGSVQRTRSSS